jgi:hypothetical protein
MRKALLSGKTDMRFEVALMSDYHRKGQAVVYISFFGKKMESRIGSLDRDVEVICFGISTVSTANFEYTKRNEGYVGGGSSGSGRVPTDWLRLVSSLGLWKGHSRMGTCDYVAWSSRKVTLDDDAE